jgi:CHAT domain-containing protein/Tfp pilus assembly protein PilF
VTLSRVFRSICISSFCGLTLLAAGLLAGCRQKSLAPFPGEVNLPAEPGATVERAIKPGERQAFRLRLGADSFVLLEISQRTVSLASRVLDSAGEEVAAGEGTDGPGTQLLALLSGHGGVYRLEVIPHGSPGLSSRYRATVRQSRPAAGDDKVRVEAAQALTEGRRLMAKQSPEALGRFKAALASWQATGDARGEVAALGDVASYWGSRGNQRAALDWSQKALGRARQSGSGDLEAWTLTDMGFWSRKLAKYDQAAEFYRQSLQAWQRVGGPWEQAYVLQGLGNVYHEKEDPVAELQTFQRALPLAVASGDIAQQALALAGVGSGHYYQFRPGEAREAWEKALVLSREAGETQAEAFVEQNLAALYSNQGQFQRALELFNRAVAQVPSAGAGSIRLNLGNLYFELGNPEKALENYELARAAFAGVGPVSAEVNALIGIGRTRQRLGDPRAALGEYEKAGRLSPEEPSVHYSTGLALLALNDPRQALPALERALALAREKKSRTRETASLFALGTAHARLGQPALAAECLGQAIARGNEIEYTSVVALSLLGRAQLRRDQGLLAEALADARQALGIVESTRRNIAADQLRIGFSAARRTYYDLEMDLLMRLGRKAEALNVSESARARGLLDLLAEGRIDVSQGLDPDLRRREEDLADQVSQIQRKLSATDVTPERAGELRGEFQKLDGQREQLDLEIRTRNKRYAGVRYPVPLTLPEIQTRLLDDRTALLEYSLGDSRSTLFVITRKGMSTYDLPPGKELSGQVRRLRAALDQESLLTQKDYLESAFQLYTELLAPAARELAGKSNLLVAPDAALYYIPFEALLTEAAGDRSYRDLPYLLRRYSIAYIPSASVLDGLREPRPVSPAANRLRAVVFAPFALSGSKDFGRLRASEREARGIAGLYPQSALSFLGQDATVDAVTRNPAVATARRLHFATHAKIDEGYPESSALILAARPGSREDGLLQVPKIFNLKLAADLAVLSACQTALGREVTGEGLVGLTRAFFYAGVPSLVVSLWNVTDGPTPDLMLDFYRNLDRQQEKAKALQSAKLSMIARGAYSHPSYWAPFILLGEPR